MTHLRMPSGEHFLNKPTSCLCVVTEQQTGSWEEKRCSYKEKGDSMTDLLAVLGDSHLFTP